MIYRSTKTFNQQLAKLKPAEQRRCLKSIATFKTDSANPLLRAHKLTAKYEGYQSINAGGDLRIIYRATEDYTEFTSVGSHSQLYG